MPRDIGTSTGVKDTDGPQRRRHEVLLQLGRVPVHPADAVRAG
jgi:hypothetical protein